MLSKIFRSKEAKIVGALAGLGITAGLVYYFWGRKDALNTPDSSRRPSQLSIGSAELAIGNDTGQGKKRYRKT